jgi:pimeloyl-ACP methyl ester carboxylesterase
MIAESITWQGKLGRIAGLRIGAPNTRAAVLLPGLACNAGDWPRPLLKGLIALGCQVHALDWPDSGLSQRLASRSYSISELAWEARSYAQANLKGCEIHWLGLSMGSLVLQELAQQQAPAASYTLLFTSAGSWSHGLGRLATLVRMLSTRVDGTPEQAVYTLTALREELAARPNERDLAELRRRVQRSVQRGWPYGRAPLRQLVAVTDYFAGGGTRVRDLGAPTMIIHGALDPLLPVLGAKALSRQLEGSRFLELANTGHELLATRIEEIMTPLALHIRAASTRHWI